MTRQRRTSTLKTTACILLLAAAGWGQQVAVPQGGSLGPSCNLSDGLTLGADKLDGSHGSVVPAANAVPVADSNGKVAPGWIPLPTASSVGGIFMDADCLAGNHVSGIDLATGRLKCSADTGTGGGLGGTVTSGKILLAASSTTAGDSAMTENSGDITSTKKQKAPSFEGTATSDQSLILPAVTSETVSATGQAKLIAKSNQLQLSVNGGPFAAVGANLPPGADTQVPFNDGMNWGTLSGYTFNKTTGALAVPGPIIASGTTQIASITEAAPSNAVAGKGKVMFNSVTHRPVYCYDGTTLPCSDNVLQADTSATSVANKIVKLDGNGLLSTGMLPVPAAAALGGVMAKAAETNKVLLGIGTDGVPSNGYLPVPSITLRGGVYMPAGCSTGYHVASINLSTGELNCTQDATTGGSGAFTKIYDTRFTAQRALISTTSMVVASADSTYLFSASGTQQDIGVGCSAHPNWAVVLTYTDADTNVARNVATTFVKANNTDGANLALDDTTIGTANTGSVNSYMIRAKSGTAVQFSVTYNANGAGCATWPAFNLSPLLVQVN